MAENSSFDLYASINDDGENEPEIGSRNEDIPPGWEKHGDEDGPYFCHIKTGLTQRELPVQPKDVTESPSGSISRRNPIPLISPIESNEHRSSLKSEDKTTRFIVRSLGCKKISEKDLIPKRSPKAINDCILKLKSARSKSSDVDGRWGDGHQIYMDIDDFDLKLVEPSNDVMLNIQPISAIRVWSVETDNNRYFAYVARDRSTQKHMCHVFKCKESATLIVNELRIKSGYDNKSF